MNKFVIIAAAAAAVAIAIGVGATMSGLDEVVPPKSGQFETVTLGALLPQTGDLSSDGEEASSSVRLAAADFNEYLESKGTDWRIEVSIDDSATNPVIALEKLQAFNSKDVNLIVGPHSSAEVRNIKGYSDSNGMLLISPGSTAPSLAIPNDSVYRLVPADDKQGPALAELVSSRGVENIAVIARQDAWGTELARSMIDAFTSMGYGASDAIFYNPEAAEFSVSVSQLAEQVSDQVGMHGSDNVGVMLIGFAESVQIMQVATQYPELGEVLWFGSDANANDINFLTDPQAMDFAQKTEFVTTLASSPPNAKRDHVSTHVEMDLGRAPSTYALAAYDAVWTFGLAIEEAGTTESALIMEAIPGVVEGYVGAMGDLSLDEAGDLDRAIYDLWAIRDGDWILYGMYEPDTGVSTEMQDADMAGLPDVVRVGVLMPQTGDLSSRGEDGVLVARFAASNFNEFLESKGATWRMELVVEDSATNPVIALEKLQALKSKGVDLVVGTQSSAGLRNIKGYADSNGMLLISPGSTAPSLAIPDDSIYRLVPDDNNQGPAIAKSFAGSGVESAVVMSRQDAWGEGLSQSMIEAYRGAGYNIAEHIQYNPEATEYSSEISLLADAVQAEVDRLGADRVGVVVVGFAEIAQIMQASMPYDILNEVAWTGSDASAKEPKINEDQQVLEFAVKTGFTAPQTKTESNEIQAMVSEHALAELGHTPNTYAYSAYDAVWLFGLVLDAAQTDDVSILQEMLPDVAMGYSGAIGDIRLNTAGDLDSDAYNIWGLVDGEWAVVGEYTVSTDTLTMN